MFGVQGGVVAVHGDVRAGDLRPYLLLQILPLVLIPLWQWIYRARAATGSHSASALALYAVAKVAEL